MIYADYAATTFVDNRVLDKMLPYLSQSCYNPSSLYPQARMVRAAVENARQQIADLIHSEPNELIFTSGGTESDNLAIKGVALHPEQKKKHIITTSIEHHAILESCEWLESLGFHVTYLPIDRYGRVSCDDLRRAIDSDTLLVSVMWVNNELGTVQDISALSEIAHEAGALFHTDIVQALGTQKIDVRNSNIDLMSLSSHKIYGPKGAGALYVRNGVKIQSMQTGGQQESFIRGGTENVPGIIGFGAAAALIAAEREECGIQLRKYKSRIIEAAGQWKDVLVNSPMDCTSDSIINLAFKDLEAEGMVFWLAQEGVMASMGSACNTMSVEPSHVVKAIHLPPEYERGCLRLSLGRGITDDDVAELISAVKAVMDRMRE